MVVKSALKSSFFGGQFAPDLVVNLVRNQVVNINRNWVVNLTGFCNLVGKVSK